MKNTLRFLLSLLILVSPTCVFAETVKDRLRRAWLEEEAAKNPPVKQEPADVPAQEQPEAAVVEDITVTEEDVPVSGDEPDETGESAESASDVPVEDQPVESEPTSDQPENDDGSDAANQAVPVNEHPLPPQSRTSSKDEIISALMATSDQE